MHKMVWTKTQNKNTKTHSIDICISYCFSYQQCIMQFQWRGHLRLSRSVRSGKQMVSNQQLQWVITIYLYLSYMLSTVLVITARPLPACVPGGRLPTFVCHWTPTTALVGHRHVPSAANQHRSWRSLIRCCWTSRMEQSVNPAARVGHYTLDNFDEQSKRIYLVSDSCSAEWQCFFRTLYTNWFTYLLI